MAIKFRKDLPESGEGGKNFIKLKDKQAVVGIFRSQPYEFHSVWESGKQREVEPGHPGSKFRFRINFVVKEGASYLPKIFENSRTVYQQLGTLADEYDLEKTLIKIIRSGSEMNDTVYTFLPMPTPVLKESLAVLETLELHDLQNLGKPKPQDQSGDPGPQEPDYDSHDEIPF